MPGKLSSTLATLLLVSTAACFAGDATGGGATVPLNGGGATFPFPLYTRWMSDYRQHKGVEINYQSSGSGAGIRQLSEMTYDFGGTDGPMSDAELAAAKGGEVLHVPMVLGGVAIAYNLPGITDTLNFDGPLIADIFLGKVTKWNDARIAALNTGIRLPGSDITVVHRSEGSGTTFVFTEYLTKVSPAWAAGPGKGKDVSWPVGLGMKGNEQVSGQVTQTPGAIGYLESVYALQNRIPVGKVKNAAGAFVAPSPMSITAAAREVAASLPESTDYRISIIDSPAQDAYPMASFTWMIVYRNQTDAAKGRVLKDFLTWAVTNGQQAAAELHYAPLPESMRAGITNRIASIKLP